ncbi:MAG: hypothetical protein ACE15F_24875 [bacterium]
MEFRREMMWTWMAVLIGLVSFHLTVQAGEPVVNNYPFPFYDAKLSIYPEQPKAGEEVRVVIEGQLPGTDYALVIPENSEITVSTDGQVSQIRIPARVERVAEVGLTVLAPVTQGIVLGPFQEGAYEVLLTINGDQWAAAKFAIDPVNSDPAGPPDPQRPFAARIEFEPAKPRANEKVEVYVAGMFPSSGYVIQDKQMYVLESYPEQVSIHLTIEKPVGPELTVLIPFRELVGTIALSEGQHPVRGYINDQLFENTLLPVGAAAGQPWLFFERSGGFIGRTQTIQVDPNGRVDYKTTFETGDREPVSQLDEETLTKLRDLLAVVDFSRLEPVYLPDHEIADGYFYTLAFGGYKVEIGQEVVLPEELAALKTLLEEILEGQHQVTAWISFERSGGFAGWTLGMTIDLTGQVKYRQTPDSGSQNTLRYLDEETLSQLTALLQTVDFSRLDPVYMPPAPVADGYNFTLASGGSNVVIGQEAVIPEELANLVVLLQAILEGQHVRDAKAEAASGVEFWDQY